MHNIAIDGPAGAGKSTIAKIAAKKLGFIYVDTGAMYRAMALYFIRNGISGSDEAAVSAACPGIDISIEYQGGEQVVLLNNENVNAFIRTEEVSMMTSDISKYAAVRSKLLDIQRSLARTKDVIMDGRDIGTCVLPDARTKIYLTASTSERAKRRHKEQTERGISCDIGQIERDIAARDEQDMNREIAPLRQAEDAVLLDSSSLSIDEAVDAVINIYKKGAMAVNERS
ncbi:MAG TPA: (d)CMP kinase [Lachnospiraceae bacterium]|nr:(d)CMP kinase [Lachnospiraceae bacterium]